MTKDQQKAATHFGYTKATWDETFDEIDLSKKVRDILFSSIHWTARYLDKPLITMPHRLPRTTKYLQCSHQRSNPRSPVANHKLLRLRTQRLQLKRSRRTSSAFLTTCAVLLTSLSSRQSQSWQPWLPSKRCLRANHHRRLCEKTNIHTHTAFEYPIVFMLVSSTT